MNRPQAQKRVYEEIYRMSHWQRMNGFAPFPDSNIQDMLEALQQYQHERGKEQIEKLQKEIRDDDKQGSTDEQTTLW